MNALLTLLSENGAVYPVNLDGFDLEKMAVSGAPDLPLGAPVRIYQDPRLWLGEVVETSPEGSLVIKLIHFLADVHELTRLADRFLGKDRLPASTLS